MGTWEEIIGLGILLAIIVAFFVVASRTRRRTNGRDSLQRPISNAPLFGPTGMRAITNGPISIAPLDPSNVTTHIWRR